MFVFLNKEKSNSSNFNGIEIGVLKQSYVIPKLFYLKAQRLSSLFLNWL